MSEQPFTSPRPARFLLRCILPPAAREALLDDLEDSFLRRVRQMGRRRAALLYWREVLDPALFRLLLHHRRKSRKKAHGKGGVMLAILTQELVQTGRRLVRSPGFCFLTVLTLSLGIGVNAVMFGIVDRLLLRSPLHVESPDRVKLVHVRRVFFGRPDVQDAQTFVDYKAYSEASSFQKVGVVGHRQLTLGHGESAIRVRARVATASLFPTLGVRPLLGRFFTPLEDRPGEELVAVLSHRFWVAQFAGERSVLGAELDFGDHRATVIGVAPAGFNDVELGPMDLWLPIRSYQGRASAKWEDQANSWWLTIPVRLEDGVSLEAAEAEASSILGVTDRTRRPVYGEGRITLESLIAANRPHSPGEARVSAWLAGVSALVLLISCANVSNLLLVRGIRRRHETSLRLSLGMSRPRLALQHLLESLLLAVAGGLAALSVSVWGGELVRAALVPDVDWSSGSLSVRLFLFSLVLTLLCGLLAGLAPVLQSRSPGLSATLRAESGTISTRRSWLRNTLLTAQTVFSVILLVGAGLFVNSLQQVERLDLGFESEGVSVLFPVRAARLSSQESLEKAVSLLGMIARIPGVERASATTDVPFGGSYAVSLRVPGREGLPDTTTGGPYIYGVLGDYFATLGIDILQGRAFGEQDRPGSAPVAVVGRTMAQLLWPDEDALGKCLVIGGEENPCTTVVGVAEDARRQGLVEDATMLYYVPAHQLEGPGSFLLKLGPGFSEEHLRRELYSLDPSLRFVSITALSEMLDPHKRAWQLGALAFVAFGLLALLVAAVGLYSSLSFEVAQRRQEMGIRTALGASSKHLLGLVLSQALRVALAGCALGLLAAAWLAPWLEDLLFQTSPHQTGIYVAVGATLLVTAVLAGLLPSLRASRSDPIRVLRRV